MSLGINIRNWQTSRSQQTSLRSSLKQNRERSRKHRWSQDNVCARCYHNGTPSKTYLVWIVLRLRNPDNDGFIICAPPQPTVPKTNPPAAPIHAATSLDDDIVIFSSWTWESRNNCNNYCAITDCVREQWESWRALFKYYGRCNSFSSWSRLLSFDNRRSLGVDHWLKKIYLALMMNFYVYLRVRIASLVNHRSLIGCIDHWRLTIGCNLVTPR